MRKRIKGLERAGERAEIYRLLRLLRDWETRMVARGLALPKELGGGGSSSELPEVVDLADDEEPIDVDSYIIEVLIVDEVRVKRDHDGGAAGGTCLH